MIIDSSFNPRLLLNILVLTIIFFDQLFKSFAQDLLFVICNRGIAFGLGNVGVFVPVFVLSIIFLIMVKEKSFYKKVGLGLVLSGGVSNLIDRIFYGCVRDFIAIGKFPAFNLADSAITVGALILFFSLVGNYCSKDEI